jgi:hypothetical protein
MLRRDNYIIGKIRKLETNYIRYTNNKFTYRSLIG